MPIIIERLLYNLSLASQYVINRFKNEKIYDNTYGIIYDLPNIKKLTYLFISAFIIFIMYNVEIKLNHIFGLFLILIIIYLLIQKDSLEFNEYLSNKELELDFLNKILFENKKDYSIGLRYSTFYPLSTDRSYLYINPLVVTLLYKLREFSQYNFTNYKDIIFHINNIFDIQLNMTENSNNKLQLFEIAYQEYTRALNSYQSMIYSLPSAKAINIEYKDGIELLEKLLLHNIHEMKNLIIDSNKGETSINTISDTFFDDFIIKPNPDIKTFANRVFNFYI